MTENNLSAIRVCGHEWQVDLCVPYVVCSGQMGCVHLNVSSPELLKHLVKILRGNLYYSVGKI
jgi:hypothetical protein